MSSGFSKLCRTDKLWDKLARCCGVADCGITTEYYLIMLGYITNSSSSSSELYTCVADDHAPQKHLLQKKVRGRICSVMHCSHALQLTSLMPSTPLAKFTSAALLLRMHKEQTVARAPIGADLYSDMV